MFYNEFYIKYEFTKQVLIYYLLFGNEYLKNYLCIVLV